jgi:hypothetical protein
MRLTGLSVLKRVVGLLHAGDQGLKKEKTKVFLSLPAGYPSTVFFLGNNPL